MKIPWAIAFILSFSALGWGQPTYSNFRPGCFKSKDAKMNIIYLHGLLGAVTNEYDGSERLSRIVIRDIARHCKFNVVAPFSWHLSTCPKRDTMCWDSDRENKPFDLLPSINRQAKDCLGDAATLPTIVVGFSNGGYYTAHLAEHLYNRRQNTSYSDPETDYLQHFFIAQAANPEAKLGYTVIPASSAAHHLEFKSTFNALQKWCN